MSLIADGLLIATCLTTALYCLVLSRRLKRLSSTDEGVGQQILRLNTALKETKAAVAEIRSTASAASGELESHIEAAKRQSNQLQMQIARALKSGVGSAPATPEASANQPKPGTIAQPERPTPTRDREEIAATPIVDFEAADDPMTELEADEQFRHADRGDETVEDDDAGPDPDDIAAGANHWPFEERAASDLDAELDADLDDEEIEGFEDLSETTPSDASRRPARRRGGGNDDESGLLRVERMTV